MCNYEVLKEHCVIMRFSIVITLWCSINTQLRKRNYVMIHRNYKVQNGNYRLLLQRIHPIYPIFLNIKKALVDQ